MSHRLFAAIRPPAPVRDTLIDLMDGVDNARWQDDDQVHLTLRFMGEVEVHQADDLAEALGAIRFTPFDVTIAGTGFFEKKGRIHTLYAGVEPCEPLLALQRKVERVCVSVGLPVEERKYHPHVTLARINQSCGDIAPFLIDHATLKLPPWRVEGFALYEAILRDQGSLYQAEAEYPARPA